MKRKLRRNLRISSENKKNLKENSSFESIKEEIDKVEKFNKLTEEEKTKNLWESY